MSEGESVQIKGQPLRCRHCEWGKFVRSTAQLNTPFLEFLDLGWLNKSADIYVCTHCGFLHWFLEPEVEQQVPIEESAEEDDPEQVQVPAEEPVSEDDLTEPTKCLACHQRIPAGSAKCPACGWSYQ